MEPSHNRRRDGRERILRLFHPNRDPNAGIDFEPRAGPREACGAKGEGALAAGSQPTVGGKADARA